MKAAVAPEFKEGAKPVLSLKPEAPANANHWKDLPFAVAFVVHVLVVFVLMCALGVPLLKKDVAAIASATSSSSTVTTPVVAPNSGFSSDDMKTVLEVAAVLAVVASLVAFVMFNLVINNAKFVISFTLWFNFVLNIAFALFAIVAGIPVVAVIFFLLGLMAMCYRCFVRKRIPFAAANLQVGAAAVQQHYFVFPLAYALIVVQLIWIVVWAIALVGVATKVAPTNPNTNGTGFGTNCTLPKDCLSNVCGHTNSTTIGTTCLSPVAGGQVVVLFFMLVSFYWGITVIKNVLHTTVAGTVATWWVAGSNARGVTTGAFRRATTTSFGSVCFGSLIVAILQTLELIAKESLKQGDWVACVAQCILSCLRGIMEYINRWAFIYVGIYGYTFMEAGKHVFTLFHNRGLTAIVNDDLIGIALTFVSLASGVICGALGLAYATLDPAHASFSGAKVVFPILGLAFGIGVTLVPLSIVDSAVATVFVCFAEDPSAFARSHPELHNTMVDAWRVAHPDAMMAFYPA
ncbi:Aste57867_22105 [Aphanomyces stellatus]|uniref:Choline transporter-like protein n=1 Tax=Aphanomyces stellatus TaxID=120398 RepID=A0A485LLB8_9STRA|nr:hypothetical protein As57867_022036 [Aphanomyces stellatus]VFT98773.1 Aste57867_22105 [Aphanomyces stellatus]